MRTSDADAPTRVDLEEAIVSALTEGRVTTDAGFDADVLEALSDLAANPTPTPEAVATIRELFARP